MPRTRKVPTMPLSEKGPTAPRPKLGGAAERAARELERWPGVLSRAHWEIDDDTVVDGADFYIGEEELGHIHLDGEAHIPMPAAEARRLIAAGHAKRFPWAATFVVWPIRTDADIARALALFERSRDRIRVEHVAKPARARR